MSCADAADSDVDRRHHVPPNLEPSHLMRHILAITALGILGTTGTASALNQSEHAAITVRTCLAAGFNDDFCERVGDEVYNTDFAEFNTLPAHSQPDPGVNACTAAGKSMQRLLDLGRETRAALRAVKAQPTNTELSAKVAKAIGRALHTIEDNCAHEGRDNPQHAWSSLKDTCKGTSESPDLQDAARSCAEREATAIFSALGRSADELGVDRSVLAPWETAKRYPPRAQVCAFLRDASTWDGRDRRWNNAIVVPAFRNQLVKALTTDTAQLDSICAGGRSLAILSSAATVDTSAGQPLCFKVNAYCFASGKADGEDEAPPWETESEEQAAAGCDAGAGGAGWLLALFAASVASRTRRRHR